VEVIITNYLDVRRKKRATWEWLPKCWTST